MSVRLLAGVVVGWWWAKYKNTPFPAALLLVLCVLGCVLLFFFEFLSPAVSRFRVSSSCSAHDCLYNIP
jgi:hypothetical protein